ncbi:MAG: mechanosensitive ion channel [bacterium]|nr:mechanosensitive ion channel [bacterium]
MDRVLEFLSGAPVLLHSAAVLAMAVIVLGVLNRILQRNAGQSRRFRHQLTMLAATLVTVLAVILALPLDAETQGQLLGLYGILVSAAIALSASTLLGNAMAGIMLKTVRNFRSGDFVQVGDHFGRVTERGLFHTEIQTPDRDLTTLPNLFLATTPVKVLRSSGTVVSATCSLGYDIHHGRIEELLLAAAAKARLEDAFVQVLQLGDFSVTYKVAGLLKDVKSLLAARSRLRTAMLDVLHEGDVEIVSPSFRNVRNYDADETFIPDRPHLAAVPVQDAAPMDVVFDKAEEAESLATLEQRRQQIRKELKEVQQAVKDAVSEQAAERSRKRLAVLQARLEVIEQGIADRREGIEEDDG